MNFEWEKISSDFNVAGGSNAYRAKVIGGWVILNNTYTNPVRRDNERNISESMCFVPDVNHEWVI